MHKLWLLVLLLCSGCGWGNKDAVKNNAVAVFKQAGFTIVGYEGYQLGMGIPLTSFGGADVWYIVKKIPDNGIIYHAAIQRWGDEYHIYSLRAVDAIQPN